MKNIKRRDFIKKAGVGAAGGVVAASTLATPAIAQNKRTLTMVTSVPHGFAVFDDAAVTFCKYVAELTDGQLTIDKKAAGELVGAFEVFDAVSSGQADCYHSAEYYFGGQHPGLYYMTSVPYGLTAEEFYAWYYHGGGHDLHTELGKIFNMKSFIAGNTGLQPGGWYNKEINSADDFNGLKFRMPGIGGQALALTGASVQVLPGGEIYQALASGSIDGAEWIGPFADEKMGFQEVCKFYYTAGYHEPGSALCSAFNLDVYESFTPTQKKVVEIAAKATSLNNYSLGLANNGAALKRIVAQGVKIMEFPDNVWDLFGESAVKAMDKYMDDSLYAQIRESYETSLRGTTSWLDRADRTYVKQRARVYNL